MDRMLQGLGPMIALAVPGAFIAAAYFIITIDRTRENSPSKEDTQVGIKLVIWAFILAGIGLAASGIDGLLSFVVGGFKGGSMGIRKPLAPVVVGAGTVVMFGMVLLPKTNNATMKQVERYAFGFLGFFYGIQALAGLTTIINGVFVNPSWGAISGGLSGTVVNGAVGFMAILMLGSKSGWTGPAPPQRMMQQMPGQQPPPQGGGYPPQGGGYPPQGGGYPPQGGGGYPPQGGGGYPPQGGGGYPPQGGGYGGGYPPQA